MHTIPTEHDFQQRLATYEATQLQQLDDDITNMINLDKAFDLLYKAGLTPCRYTPYGPSRYIPVKKSALPAIRRALNTPLKITRKSASERHKLSVDLRPDAYPTLTLSYETELPPDGPCRIEPEITYNLVCRRKR